MPRTARTQAAAPDAAFTPEPPRASPRRSPATSRWEFPGCEAIHLSRDELADYEGKVEFWGRGARDRLGGGDTQPLPRVPVPDPGRTGGPCQRRSENGVWMAGVKMSSSSMASSALH